MPILSYERNVSRSFDLSGRAVSLTVHWIVTGTMDETTAYLRTLLDTPKIYDGLVRDGIRGDDQGGGNWYCDVTYKNIDVQHALGGNDPLNPGGPGGDGGSTPGPQGPATEDEDLQSSYSFEASARTVRITQSLGTQSKTSANGFQDTDKDREQAAAAGFNLDNKRAIGPGPDGVAGTEKYVPQFTWQREVVRPNVNKKYLRTLRDLVGRVNDAKFYQWTKGEVLYLGASGRQQNGRWLITHKFDVSETELAVDVGNGIFVPEVRGWEYIWFQYRPEVVGKFTLQVPVSAYVEQICREGDFSKLEIGGVDP